VVLEKPMMKQLHSDNDSNMIDLTFIGKAGLVIEYDDIVSLTGMNIVNYLMEKDKSLKVDAGMSSFEDILSSYINRTDKDFSIWIKQLIGLDVKKENFINSYRAFKPNLFYAYKLIPNAYKNGIKDLYIYNQYESEVIREYLKSFEVPVGYVYGDIREVMKDKVNYTYITCDPENVRRCRDIDTPFAVTICDDYMSMLPIVRDHVDEDLRNKGKFVSYTSILNAGGIPK
jgi:hypothetical protein